MGEQLMSILIGFEESGTLCGEFRRRGYDAYSADLAPTRGDPQYHYQEDIIETLTRKPWQLIILHPPCDALALCGNRTYGRDMPKHDQRLRSIRWTRMVWNAATRLSPRVALENPASVIFQYLRGGRTQWIQPWQYGHPEKKKTGFHLFNLPELQPTTDLRPQMANMTKAETEKVFYMSPGPNRKRDRSKTYDGVSRAIVDQWGSLL